MSINLIDNPNTFHPCPACGQSMRTHKDFCSPCLTHLPPEMERELWKASTYEAGYVVALAWLKSHPNKYQK